MKNQTIDKVLKSLEKIREFSYDSYKQRQIVAHVNYIGEMLMIEKTKNGLQRSRYMLTRNLNAQTTQETERK